MLHEAEVLSQSISVNHCQTFTIVFSFQTIDNFDSWNVTREFHSWGQPLVLDLSFLSDMTFKQAKSIAYRELAFSLKHNRKSREPFALYMCNYNPKYATEAVVKWTKVCARAFPLPT